MESSSTLSRVQEQQERSLFLFVVVIGYIVTFILASRGNLKYSAGELILGIVLGAIYLIVGFFDRELFRRIPELTQNVLFFSIEIAAVFGIGWTLGPGGSWLIGIPLAGIAVERLPAGRRWPLYLGLLGAIVLPILRYSTWDIALVNGFIISTAILFVAVVSEFRLNERQARERAERLAMELELANHRLARYASQAEELAAAHERNRLAREIHDNLGHYLTVASVQIEAAKVTLATEPSRALDALDKAHDHVKRGLAGVRESVSALRVSPVENRTLAGAIGSLVEEARTDGYAVRLHVLGEPAVVVADAALAVYRAAQEGLTNIRKHASASTVDVELDFSQPDLLRLTVRDDGCGASETSGGFGLIGIRERVNLLGGQCRVETQPGNGFCLEVVIPATGGEGE